VTHYLNFAGGLNVKESMGGQVVPIVLSVKKKDTDRKKERLTHGPLLTNSLASIIPTYCMWT
jgi:hypothetical protein